MNGLKKFQEFALNADEQKSVKGGLRADWKCYKWNSAGTGFTFVGNFGSDASATAWCIGHADCAYCN